MLDQSQSQEEANAILFEKTRVQARSKNDYVPTCETTGLYVAIKTENELVVSNKWFQGASTRRIWFYRWWDPGSYPFVFDTPSTILHGWVFFLLFVELVLLLPMWCLVPFSQNLATWSHQLIYNSAYFKFLSSNMLYLVFLALLMLHAFHTQPLMPVHEEYAVSGTGSLLGASDSLLNLASNTSFVRGYQFARVVPITWVELITGFWTIGLLAGQVQLWFTYTLDHFTKLINQIDLLSLSSLFAAFLLRLISLPHSPMRDEMKFFCLECSEICYAVGSTFAVLKLTHLFTYYERLGPLYQSVIAMFSDITSFLFLLFITLFSFWVGFVFLLRRFFFRSRFRSQPKVEIAWRCWERIAEHYFSR